MPVLRRGPASLKASATTVVFSDTNPYRSRRLTVETDGATTVAYLRDARDTVVGAVWIANHPAAARSSVRARLDAGLPPVMPGAATRHLQGRATLDPTE